MLQNIFYFFKKTFMYNLHKSNKSIIFSQNFTTKEKNILWTFISRLNIDTMGENLLVHKPLMTEVSCLEMDNDGMGSCS